MRVRAGGGGGGIDAREIGGGQPRWERRGGIDAVPGRQRQVFLRDLGELVPEDVGVRDQALDRVVVPLLRSGGPAAEDVDGRLRAGDRP